MPWGGQGEGAKEPEGREQFAVLSRGVGTEGRGQEPCGGLGKSLPSRASSQCKDLRARKASSMVL